jgi:hypothetical protein
LFLMTKTTTLCIFHEHPYIFKIGERKTWMDVSQLTAVDSSVGGRLKHTEVQFPARKVRIIIEPSWVG